MRAAAVGFLTPSGNRHQRQVTPPGLGAYSSGDLVAVDLRHADIQQHDLGPHAPGSLERRGAVGCAEDLVPAQLEKSRRAVEGVDIIVNDQNPALHHRRRSLRSGRCSWLWLATL